MHELAFMTVLESQHQERITGAQRQAQGERARRQTKAANPRRFRLFRDAAA